MSGGITVRVLGDYGPFSRIGKSIGYQVLINGSSYLVDCGSPLFQQIGGHGLKTLKGLVITHCHDDHKRWFSDLALFNMYAPDITERVTLLTSEEINRQLVQSSEPALSRSLSRDSKRVVDLAYETYVDYRMLGPRARYRIVVRDEGLGKSSLAIVDTNGNPAGPDKAKIIISRKYGTLRMLFKDPDYGEWVEPECFYPFSSGVFYEHDMNVFRDPTGFTIEAFNAPVWHGVPSIGVKFKTDKETLVFSADTCHDIELWKQLCTEKHVIKPVMPFSEFEAASIIHGDINDFVERIWSRERFEDAVRTFDDAITIHDIAVRNSVVHTDYRKLPNTVLRKDCVILTHSPDTMTSEWVLSKAEKTFRINGPSFFEVVDGCLYPCDADLYHKEAGRYFVGYRNPSGAHYLYENDKLLTLSAKEEPDAGRLLYRADLYEDISGKYFPVLLNSDKIYQERKDGRVELLEITNEGSKGKIVDNIRGRLPGLHSERNTKPE
jgi:hypothetical protein